MKNLQISQGYEVEPSAPDELSKHAQAFYATGIPGVTELRADSYTHIQQDAEAESFIGEIMATSYDRNARPRCNMVTAPENFGITTYESAMRAGRAIMRTYGADVQLVSIDEATEDAQAFCRSVSYLANRSHGIVIAMAAAPDVVAVKEQNEAYAFVRALAARELPAILMTQTNAVLLDEHQFSPIVAHAHDFEQHEKVLV